MTFLKRNYPSSKVLIKLLARLKNLDSDTHVDKQRLAKYLFKDPSKQVLLSNKFSLLHEICREWLILRDFQGGSLSAYTHITEILSRSGLSEHDFLKWSKNVRKRFSEQPERDIYYFFNNWRINHLTVFHPATKHNDAKLREQQIALAESNLDNFYALTKLSYTCEKVLIAHIHTTENVEEINDSALALSYTYIENENPIIVFLCLIIQISIKPNDEQYHRAKEILETNIQSISTMDKALFYNFLVNYSVRRLREKGEDFYPEMFALYKFGSENKLITNGSQIAVTTFLNIVTTACISKENSWASLFIEKYKDLLPQNQKADTLGFAKARLLFAEKKYKKAAAILSVLSYEQDFFVLRIPTLLICCHVESADRDLEYIQVMCRNFISRLKNQKFGIVTKSYCLNFAKFVIQLCNTNTDYILLRKEIENSVKVVYKSWLLDMIEIIKK